MTQPQHGSARSEVDDLRNIVDRLDLLMGAAAPTAGSGSRRAGIEREVADLTDRVVVIEQQVDELRTLINHLMTIATWQAKVTAQLVDDEVGDEQEEVDGVSPATAVVRAATAQDRGDSGQGRRFGGGRDRPVRAGQRATTLDDDIDDILGVDRSPPDRDDGPPDFGI